MHVRARMVVRDDARPSQVAPGFLEREGWKDLGALALRLEYAPGTELPVPEDNAAGAPFGSMVVAR